MLIAIGIYNVERQEDKKAVSFNKCKQAQRSKGFFVNGDLDKVEKETLPLLLAVVDKKGVIYIDAQDEHHYIDTSRSTDNIYVIVSQKKLETSEVYHLFCNIYHAHHRPALKIELPYIIMNPFGFTGRDHLIGNVQQRVDETKELMIQLIEKTIQRGEQIEVLSDKAIQLEQDAEVLRFKSAQLNKCCSYM